MPLASVFCSMVKIFIQANFQKNTGVLAAPANPRPIGKTKT